MKRLTDAFYKSGLLMDFLETLINDISVPQRLRRQVWTLCTTEWDEVDNAVEVFAREFCESTDELDLISRWEPVADDYWARFPEMLLKAKIDGRKLEVTL